MNGFEGIDPLVWNQAKADNPNPDLLIPYPILGFGQLRERQKMQIQEAALQQSFVQVCSNGGEERERTNGKMTNGNGRILGAGQ